ncbi:DUF2845 domain-containing protein [Pseudomonas sp. UL073]|uniref:DUF2845 domain-containing protein n=1 Tax=Zestomonas insulae TaxID=2809017 RepID=A0ABS2IIK8_9GAMM|nr:DUF2845 domain-containing protein [Pseudomonas insulae]MBM7062889.1 DUF2845 domain-containing protein [Pseudomonas insulae]
MRKPTHHLLILLLVTITSLGAQASTLRCGSKLVSEGDLSADVLRKCGEPDEHQVIPPSVRPTVNSPGQAVTVENWIYGPSGGAYRYLRFLDGRLTEIRIQRD